MEEDRVRTTQEIKRNLFTSTPIFGEKLGMHVNEQQGVRRNSENWRLLADNWKRQSTGSRQ